MEGKWLRGMERIRMVDDIRNKRTCAEIKRIVEN